MSKNSKDIAENVNSTNVDTTEPMVYVIKLDGGYQVESFDGTIGDLCKLDQSGAICLTKNEANRKWVMVKIVDAYFEENGSNAKYPLSYKATRVIGSGSNKLPNEKLIAYLPEDLQEEYKAIIARAIQARDAERAAAKKPLTEADKARAKVTKAIEQLKALGMSEADIKALIENAANNTEEEQN